MARTISSVMVVAMMLAGIAVSTARAADPAPKATGFTAQAVVLPPRTVGKTVLRDAPKLAVEIRVRVQNYRPGGFEPLLVIDGKPQTLASGVADVQGRETILAFVVESPSLLRDGASLALQMKADGKSRTPIPGRLTRKAIKPLDAKAAEQAKLPALDEWLRGPPAPGK